MFATSKKSIYFTTILKHHLINEIEFYFRKVDFMY